MYKMLALLFLGALFAKVDAQTNSAQYPVYHGSDLGLTYTASVSSFRIWSPVADQAELLLYRDGIKGDPFRTVSLDKSRNGTWFTQLKGNYAGIFYAFRVFINHSWNNPVPDPYAKAVGVNGKRAMVIDLRKTNPLGWAIDRSPTYSRKGLATDAIIYEMHIRDFSIDSSSGITHKGQYLGLAELGTKTRDGLSTGLSHLKELGVTHVHLLPFFDFNSIDETKPDSPQYNWGYDPLNYNVPDGSYSTNPYDGVTRIRELKELIETLHRNGLRVIMDVVYNHTGTTESSNFNQLVPGYYYRHKPDGSLSNGTGCGNETASEMPMMRKFMLESLLYWEKEYHIDGFRFDLMGIHDIQTMNLISDSLHVLKPDIVLYGEGWTAGDSPLPDSLRAVKKNVRKLRHIAVFSDDIRDGIKGSVFDIHDRGFASGNIGDKASVTCGIVASVDHPQIEWPKVNYSKGPYAIAPANIITYCECHDNNTLWDKLTLSYPTASNSDRRKMQELALTIVLTSQGIPFLYEGSEFLRTKQGVDNSFRSPDSINAIHWQLKAENLDVTRYVEGLIRLRKAHPAFRMATQEQIRQNIFFDTTAGPGTIVYLINGAAVHDSWKDIWVAFNGTGVPSVVTLPPGQWTKALGVGIDNTPNRHSWSKTYVAGPTISGQAIVRGYSTVILYRQ